MLEKPIYFPIDRPLYEVGPGLKPLGFDFGQGAFDSQVFQLDSEWSIARENKVSCLLENPNKYILRHEFPQKTEQAVFKTILGRLLAENSDEFTFDEKRGHLFCHRSKDEIVFTPEGQLIQLVSQTPWPKNLTALDALILQVQEDLAITRRTDPETDFLAYLNLCSASHWSPAEKIGKNFGQVHAPIPGNDKLVKASKNLVEAMIHKGPFVRFVWSFVTDTRLNHHPEPPPGIDPAVWKGRSFDNTQKSPFFLRVERQTTWGIPNEQASIFTIRVSFIPGTDVKANPDWREKMKGALQSMAPQSKQYKGVAHCFDELIGFLS